MQAKNFKPIKAIKPEKDALNVFIGKELLMMPEEGSTERKRVTVHKIQGSMFKPTRFEVNNEHFIVILDAYKQLHNDKSITEDQIAAFDESVVENIERVKPESAIDATKAAPSFPKDAS